MREVDSIKNIATDIFHANDKRFDMAKTLRFTKKAIEGLQLTLNSSVKTDVVTILANSTAPLPQNCAQVYKVGTIGCGGKCIVAMGRIDTVYNLKNIQNQNKFVPCENCTCSTTETASIPQLDDVNYGCTICDSLVFHGYEGNARGELYAVRKPLFTNGQYAYDEVNNRLVFADGCDVYTGSELVVEYKPLLSSEDYQLVPKIAFDLILHKTNTYLMTGGEKQYAEKLYRDYHYKFKRDTFSYNLDWIAAILRG